jgi:hypothetical protein
MNARNFSRAAQVVYDTHLMRVGTRSASEEMAMESIEKAEDCRQMSDGVQEWTSGAPRRT